MQQTEFELDDEQRARVTDCLRKEGIRLAPETQAVLLRDIGYSIRVFLKDRSKSKASSREVYNALRSLWTLAHEEDPLVAQLRGRIRCLPREAVEYLERRAGRVIPLAFSENDVEAGFLAWAETASAHDLVTAVRVLSAEGGKLVSRSRGACKRSAPKLEPLIRNLAVDWIKATGGDPLPGRSDHGGFGDLVHCVFQWVREPAAAQALRRHWAAVEEGKARGRRKEQTAPS
jgi:hypothetical protein